MMASIKNLVSKITICKAIGLVLLLPPIISVYLFLVQLDDDNIGDTLGGFQFSIGWTGDYFIQSTGTPDTVDFYENDTSPGTPHGGGGYASPIPIYFGLMAIAGALLLKKD